MLPLGKGEAKKQGEKLMLMFSFLWQILVTWRFKTKIQAELAYIIWVGLENSINHIKLRII